MDSSPEWCHYHSQTSQKCGEWSLHNSFPDYESKASPNIIGTTKIPKLEIWLISVFIPRIPAWALRLSFAENVLSEFMEHNPDLSEFQCSVSYIQDLVDHHDWEGSHGHIRKRLLIRVYTAVELVGFMPSIPPEKEISTSTQLTVAQLSQAG